VSTLVLLRHGQSAWNLENRFTGWWDVDLSPHGEVEAAVAGRILAAAGVAPTIAHTSVLTRATRTNALTLAVLGRSWIPVRSHWRLNERHYGGLTGLNKAETRQHYGEAQVHAWRRSYATPPPVLDADSPFSVRHDERYRHLAPDAIPDTECLADVVDRLLPYWYDAIAPDLLGGQQVLVTAHGNSLRALIKHLDSIGDEEIVSLEIPTGVPILYELDDQLHPTAPRRTLGENEVP
jgi:2,3-bisphosphoglycerate-dependent phosphoglycerate mutase